MIDLDHHANSAYILLPKDDSGSLCDNFCVNWMIYIILIMKGVIVDTAAPAVSLATVGATFFALRARFLVPVRSVSS